MISHRSHLNRNDHSENKAQRTQKLLAFSKLIQRDQKSDQNVFRYPVQFAKKLIKTILGIRPGVPVRSRSPSPVQESQYGPGFPIRPEIASRFTSYPVETSINNFNLRLVRFDSASRGEIICKLLISNFISCVWFNFDRRLIFDSVIGIPYKISSNPL